MDLWVVAAAAGAGYLAKYWQNFSNEKEGSLSLSGESKPRNLLQQIQERNGPFRRLRQKQLGIDDILGSENLGEIGDLATGVASTNDFDGKGKAEFSGNSDNLTDVLTTQETRFKRHKAFRSRRPLEYSIKPLDSLESCVASQLYREHENMNEYEFSSLPSPYTPTVRPLLATDGSRVISRVGGGSFRAELQFESEKKKLHKGDGMHLEENETLLGLPPLPSIGSLQLPWKLKQNVRKGRVQRSSSPGIRASSEAFHSQGSANGMFLFFLGITIGVMATLVASKREVDKLNEQLKQTENLVEDLHEELEMKDFLTVKDLTNEGFESMKTNDCSFNSGMPTAVSLEQEFNRSTKFNAIEPDNQNTEHSELMSKIEAELEAELERLEQNMKASSSLERLSDFVGLDPDFIADVVQGELRVDTLNSQPGEQSDLDLDVSGSSTHHSANYAVSPRELSLRLHEVIQSRLEARIIELEAALQNNQKRPHSMKQESIISTRELYSEVGSLSTQESPIFMDEGTNHPMVINLSGETLEAYNEACEEISKMLRTGEEVPPETIYDTDHIKEMHPFDRELSLGGNGGSIMHQDITGERWLSRNLVCDRIRSWEERTSRSWGSNEVGESEDDEEDEMGRGACCLVDKKKLPEDVWGGDAYSWSSLQKPVSFGSKGGTTTKEEDYGGHGGGRVKMEIAGFLVVDGSILADGGHGGSKGGGGSGGSIYIKAYKMTGSGRISACGGHGFGGGGGGRISVDVFSRHDDPKIFVHGGSSFGCPENSGAAGTFYDAVPRSLIVSNNNRSTDTDTLLLEFPYQPLWTNVYVRDHAKATVPLLWSRVQVQGQISLYCGGVLSFGLAHYALSEFELLAEELLMSDSIIKVYGALRMSVKMFLMWNSKLLIDGGGDANVATSLLEASNLVVLKESSVIHSNANLGVHGQGLLNLSGPGDWIEAQRLVLSLFYSIHVGPGSVLRGPLENATTDAVTPRLYCELQDCPTELLHPPEDCNVNSSLSFTLQICRVEDITVQGLIKGSVVHFHRARTIAVQSSGKISTSRMGCTGGVGRGKFLSSGLGSGGGHGGKGGDGCYKGSCVEGGISYGNADLPCELGSGSGNDTLDGSTAGGGVIVMGSLEHPLSSLSIEGSVKADGESSRESTRNNYYSMNNGSNVNPGGGSGGTILLFLRSLALGEAAVLSSIGGHGSLHGGGGGGGGRIHFHWSDIPTGDVYQPIASVKGSIHSRGGLARDQSGMGENGTVTGKACPRGLYGIFCEECPAGTYKNVTGSDRSLCRHCPYHELPRRAIYISVRGGIAETPCPYKCISDRYHMPHCYTALEELIYTFGGPWLFCLLLLGVLILLALVLSVARMKFVGVDESPGPAPTQHGSQIDHSFPFLESLNEVLETNRAEESQSHVHRMYFMGPNTFSEPWHLPHTPPEQIKEIVYEGAFNGFVDEINAIAAYQWWEGSMHSILSILAYPLAWSWQQWRRRKKLQQLREFVRSGYDHACLRSCRSRALYEGLKVAATSDLMLAHVDFFLGGDEKRTDLPFRLQQRFPMSLPFGGDGSYMAPFSLNSDNILTSLMSQAIPPTTWYRLVAGLNAQLRLVRRGRLRVTFRPVMRWLETHANPALRVHGVQVDLAWFQSTACGYCQYGLLVYAVEDETESTPVDGVDGAIQNEHQSRDFGAAMLLSGARRSTESLMKRKKPYGYILDTNSLHMLEEKKDIFYPLSFIIHNTKPVGQHDLVGLVISMLLLADISLVLLTLLQLYSISLADVFLVLFVLPLGILLPFPAGINALFSHGPRRSAGLARVYALWNITSLINVMVAFICGYVHYNTQSPSKKLPNFQPWNINMDDSEWWIIPTGLVVCKFIQSRLINWHIANLEIQDRSLYSNDFELFWQS